MRPKEQLTVKVFSPCGPIGEADYLKVSFIRLVLAKKEEILNRCPPHLRSTRKHNTGAPNENMVQNHLNIGFSDFLAERLVIRKL